MVAEGVVHQCGCTKCRAGDHPDREDHRRLNVLLGRLDEQQRRWVAAREAMRLGHGGFQRIAEITGLHPETIRRGRDELDAGLQDCPTDGVRRPGGGRPRRLTADQANRLKELLSKGATAHGWKNDLWTLRRVGRVVRVELGEKVCPAALRKALHDQLGWTLQKPVQQLRDRNDVEIERWKKEEFARIKDQARTRHSHLAFIDESGFMLAPTLRRTYAPSGHAPIQKVTDPHAKISAIAAIVVSREYRNARLVYQLSGDYANFNGGNISTFLRFLCGEVKNPVTVIWDSVRIHYAEPVKGILVGRNTLVLEKFPANAPGLNPVDGVWSYIKYGRLPNYAPFDLGELRKTLTAELRRLRKHPDLLFSFIRRTGLGLDG